MYRCFLQLPRYNVSIDSIYSVSFYAKEPAPNFFKAISTSSLVLWLASFTSLGEKIGENESRQMSSSFTKS